MNLGHLYFDIVSDLGLRISDFAGLGIFTTVVSALQIRPFLTNKPNFRKSQMNVSRLLTRDYEKKTLGGVGKTNPIQTQFKPNSKPIKPNTKPNKPNACPPLRLAGQSQYNAYASGKGRKRGWRPFPVVKMENAVIIIAVT